MIPIQGVDKYSDKAVSDRFIPRFRFDYHDTRFVDTFDKLANRIPNYARGYGVLYENDTFLVRGYCWDDDDEECHKPNFIYKPTGFEIQWYKYPLRDACSNMDITFEDFSSMVGDCIASMRSG